VEVRRVFIAELPDARASEDPSGPCVADDSLTLDNAAFLDRVRRAAAVLRAAGIRRGDVVAAVLPNRVELIVGMFAAWRLGAALTPVNPELTEGEARHQIDDSGSRVVIGEPGAPATTLAVEELAAGAPAPDGPDRPAEHDLALLIYTSGTTGLPKGVMLDHANLAADCDMITSALGLDASEHCLLVLPLFHANAIMVSVLAPLLVGGRTTIAGRFRPERFLSEIATTRPTYFSGVPTIYAKLVSLPADHAADMSSLRRVICGAAPMPAELIARFEERFGVPLLEGYGLSEGTCASTINPPDGVRKPGTVGLPLPGQRVALMDPDGRLVGPGEAGEVVISGPNVMRGYLGRPEATADTVVDGWLHTGDVGRFDEDGYLLLVDRIKDMIIRGGENLYPKEIENVLHAHPGVMEAAVIGAPHPDLGEEPVAHVVRYPGATATADDLLAHCREALARVKVPTRIEMCDELPKNAVGKIDKPALRSALFVAS
jgi:acyl-CoA synthetase (AMP-forming)/AMP-acid ligase II